MGAKIMPSSFLVCGKVAGSDVFTPKKIKKKKKITIFVDDFIIITKGIHIPK